MEALLRQGKQVCPFLNRSSPTTLKFLASSFSTTAHGRRVSALQTAATQCPVMGKALAKRGYVSTTDPARMHPSDPANAEGLSLEEAHRAAGVNDLSKGKYSLGNIELTCRNLSSCRSG